LDGIIDAKLLGGRVAEQEWKKTKRKVEEIEEVVGDTGLGLSFPCR